MMKSKSVLTVLIFVFSYLLFQFAFAQGIQLPAQDVDLKVSPENPMPGQTLTITAESYIVSLTSSNITWSLNGNVYQKGIGMTSIQVIAPDLGKKLSIGVNAITAEGAQLNAEIDITSGNIDLIVETDGYVPPFFNGKMPLVYQNSYRIVAIPHLANSSGTEYDPKTLVYSWSKDTKVMQDASGYGKQVFSWKEEIIPRSRLIKVKATTRDGSAQAEKTIILQANSPFIQFYKNDPLYGPMYNKAIINNTGLGSSRELSILAVPYGFNKPFSSVGNLLFSWSINSTSQDALSTSQSIVLRAPVGKTGSSNIDLEIRNEKDILQSARNAFSIMFSSGETEISTDNINNYNGI